MFKRCRQMWDLTSKIRQNWEPSQRYLAFDFGTAIHAGAEAYYNPLTWGDMDTMRRNAREAFRFSFVHLQQKVRIGSLDAEFSFNEDLTLGLDMLEYYFRWAPSQDNFKPIMTEIEFEVPIPGMEDEAIYQGRIDLIVEDEFGYWIVDHKTAKQFGDSQWLWLDDQCSSYAWAIQRQLGLEVRGVIYNQLKKKPPDPPRMLKSGGFSIAKNQDTDFITYLRTLKEHGIEPSGYREFLSYLKHNPKEYCRRIRISYTQQQLEIVGQRIEREAREMINPNLQIYPSPSMMNCNGCRFYGPCVQIQEGREPMMDMYEKRS